MTTAAETIMDTNMCSCSAAPPPYQLHTSFLSSDDIHSRDRPQPYFAAGGLGYSELQANSRFSSTSLPIYETYCDPLSSSPSSGNELAPEQLRNGLKTLFQGFTPLVPRTRPTSRATTVSAVSPPNRDSITGPGHEERRHSAASELPDGANPDPRAQLRSRASAPMVGTAVHIRDPTISELYDHKWDTKVRLQITPRQYVTMLFMTDMSYDEVYLKKGVQPLVGGARWYGACTNTC